jgi:hypothetical protein
VHPAGGSFLRRAGDENICYNFQSFGRGEVVSCPGLPENNILEQISVRVSVTIFDITR